MIHQELYTFLSSEASISSLVGTNIFYLNLPSSVDLPAITLGQVGIEREYTLDGYASVTHYRMRITSFATSLSEAYSISEAVKAYLDSYTENIGTQTNTMVRLLDEADIEPIPPTDGSEVWIYSRWQDFNIESDD